MDDERARTNEHGQPIGEPVEWAGATPVEPIVLAGRTVRLEPLTTQHASDLLGALTEAAGDEQWTYMPTAPCHDVAAMTAVVESLHATAGLVPFAVCDLDGRARGMASLMRIQPEVGSVEVGWIMLGAGLRRAAGATEMIELFARHVFEQGYRRFEWKCDALNAPSRRSALRFGFGFEGVWRNALVYKGRNRDTAWFAMTDDDWRLLGPAYTRWLEGLSAEGVQSRPLAAVIADVRLAG